MGKPVEFKGNTTVVQPKSQEGNKIENHFTNS